MKIAQRIVAFLLILITFSFLLVSCAPEETRGELDKTNITVLEVGMDSSLIKEKVFSSETSKLHYSFRFGSTIDVQSIRFRAYYDGKYKFNMADGYKASIYAHTGSITTDFWEDLPCEQSLKAGYEYTIEIKIHNASDVNKDLTLEVETPATNTKDISDCISFVDDYVKGELMYYTFVAPTAGKYTINIPNSSNIKIYNGDGKYLEQTGWGKWSSEFAKGAMVKLEVKMKSDITKVTGTVEHPGPVVDISEQLLEKGCLILKYTPMYADEIVKLQINVSENTPIVVSNRDVGVQVKGSNSTQKSGYGIVHFRMGDGSWVTNFGEGEHYTTVEPGTTATIEMKYSAIPKENEYYLTVFLQSVEKVYLPYEGD